MFALAEAVGPLLAESGDPAALLDLLDAVGAAMDRRAEEHHLLRHAMRAGGRGPDPASGS